MLLSLAAVILGLALLVWSADRFVEGASATAHNLGVSTLIIGITIIGFGTSAPEILISIISVIEDTPNLAIGNALGSNIANIGLILGITALILPLGVASKLIRREYPILMAATLLLGYLLWDRWLDQLDGILLIAALLLAMGYLVWYSLRDEGDAMEAELEQEIPHMTTGRALGWTLVGLLFLIGSSKLLVWGAVNIATAMGISELVIGLTIVAIGTSLPELAASIAGVRKGEPDLVIGNVIGSNLFNSLAVIGVPALMTDFDVASEAVYRDLPIMVVLTVLLMLLSFLPPGCCKLTRFKGLLLLAGFVSYQALLYYLYTQGQLA